MNLFVLGNSGHLLDLPRQEQWASGVVIAVNRIYRSSIDGRTYRPDMLVISDGRVWESDGDLIRQHPEVTLLVADWWKLHYPCIPFRSGVARGMYKTSPITDFYLQWYGYIHHINSVAFQAAQIALTRSQEGDTIYLLGCDGRWPPRGDKRRTQHHFYDDRSMLKAHRPFQINQDFHHQWKHFSDFCTANGRTLIDCSPWRDLALPNLTYGEVPCQ